MGKQPCSVVASHHQGVLHTGTTGIGQASMVARLGFFGNSCNSHLDQWSCLLPFMCFVLAKNGGKCTELYLSPQQLF